MEDQILKDQDVELARRVRDILAVATDDIDADTSEVEDGVVYIEGVVPSEQHRRAISGAVRELDGVSKVGNHLPCHRAVMPKAAEKESTPTLSALI